MTISYPVRQLVWAAAIAILALIADQATKAWILDVFADPRRVIAVFAFGEPVWGFNLRLGFNRGVSFGMLANDQPWLLSALTAAIIAVLVVWLLRAESALEAYALAAVIGGATGNLIDRLRHGGVVDFLDFYYGDWHWPTFNVADIFIVCGVVLLVLSLIVLAKRKTVTS